MTEINNYYINIYERYLDRWPSGQREALPDLKNSNKVEFDNNDLWKIFEYYSCIKLSQEYNTIFYEYDDIKPEFKEINKMSRNDTGIDCCNLIDTIVQCKLRKNTLTWGDCATFFGSQVIYSFELKKPIVRWNNLIITRNNDSTLSDNLLGRSELFIDKPYNKQELITFCENLIINPPKYPKINSDFILRDYQIEAIDMILLNNKNVIINLPTGTGKNSVIIYSMQDNLKYLILVPRIILMDQLKDEIIKHKSYRRSNIQLIGDSNNIFDPNKLITICVYNSIHLIENYYNIFEKIYIDEAHHINKPEIYYDDDNNNDLLEDNSLEDNLLGLQFDNILESSIEKYKLYTKDKLLNDINFIQDENDLVINNNYTKIIESLVKYNNNVYLSATIDKIDKFEYYSKDIRTMIDKNYLCDYTIHIPIFNDDPTNKNICEHLLKNYRNIIIYCNSQKEGKEINKLMNKLQLNSSEYIDCNIQKTKRKDIISRYKEGKIAFLVNVRILVEGFDAPITKGVCFLHLPSSKTTLIQIIGRALRLHPTKTIANIILPFSSKEDEKNICNFLKVIAKNDKRVKQSFENKKLGGYINIENINELDEEDNLDEENELTNYDFKYTMIYNSMGLLENKNEIWIKILDKVKKYIDENNKRPSSESKDSKIKQLGIWILIQTQNYKKKQYNMKSEEIYKQWNEFIESEKYKKYFMSLENTWFNTFNLLEEFINTNKKRPTSFDKNLKIKKLGKWLQHQLNNYNKKCGCFQNIQIYKQWNEFINDSKYTEYFLSNEEIWYNTFNELKDYININNKKPYDSNIDIKEKKLCKWLSHQQNRYNKKDRIMKIQKIYDTWTNFINDDQYKEYFLTNQEVWFDTLNKVKDYIDQNNKRPTAYNKDIKIKQFGIWIKCQLQNNKNKKQIMKIQEIFNTWNEFINDTKYKKYFNTNNNI